MKEIEESRLRETLSKLSPKEGAIFMFVLHLHKLESESHPPNERHDEVGWNYGIKTEKIVEDALDGDFTYLPVPFEEDYVAFSWLKLYPFNMEEARKNPIEYDKTHKALGSGDIRLMDTKCGSKPALKFFANRGRFEEVRNDWEKALNPIPYPMVVEDREGFRFENTAYKIQHV